MSKNSLLLWEKSPLIKLYQDNFSLVKHVLSSRDKNDSLPLDKAQKQQEKLAYMVGSKQQKDKNKLIFLLRNLEWTNGVMIKIMHNNIKNDALCFFSPRANRTHRNNKYF